VTLLRLSLPLSLPPVHLLRYNESRARERGAAESTARDNIIRGGSERSHVAGNGDRVEVGRKEKIEGGVDEMSVGRRGREIGRDAEECSWEADCEKMLRRLMRHADAIPFLEPVDHVAMQLPGAFLLSACLRTGLQMFAAIDI
jgi:hypothetical protein